MICESVRSRFEYKRPVVVVFSRVPWGLDSDNLYRIGVKKWFKTQIQHYFSTGMFNLMAPGNHIYRTLCTWLQVMAWCLVAPSHHLIHQNCVVLSFMRSFAFHLRSVSKDMLQIFITALCWKITHLKSHSHFAGANESKNYSAYSGFHDFFISFTMEST